MIHIVDSLKYCRLLHVFCYFQASGFTCIDKCEGDITDSIIVSVHGTEGGAGCEANVITNFDPVLAFNGATGTYHIQYVCADQMGFTVSKCRTVKVQCEAYDPEIARCVDATAQPTAAPTFVGDTWAPTAFPSTNPTNSGDTNAPTDTPTAAPTGTGDTNSPTDTPTSVPTDGPTVTPTEAPTSAPTKFPTKYTVHSKPVLMIIGGDEVTLEANRTKAYADEGAECFDLFDGQINGNVDVSGDEVRLDTPGIYHVQYNCENAAKVSADQAVRKVTVQDTTCPTCTVLGVDSVTREASFPYVDAGATCSDSLDGTLTAEDTASNVQMENTGVYLVTYTATDETGNTNHNSALGAACVQTVRTVTVRDTLRPIIAISDGGNVVESTPAAGMGVNGQSNPSYALEGGASGATWKPQLLAENKLDRSWLVAGVVSALAGAFIALRATHRMPSSPKSRSRRRRHVL
jgi:hypothetical protein